ncbi:MAG TPA: FtsX-like permease family protein [Oscillatoriales cyanobacterium M59_W2019_021]|nr:MAG: FtsX-like permease family protein [Cyanobacteria bacterium J055]HIK32283.1 FtsX-like permease family protein [Oscillatoriales cyanobacterium M4454_W2019_049]HIK49875.1 FtsX-like permease family protein [Oscillatoriales cyanobacterium M59_W2019_021]
MKTPLAWLQVSREKMRLAVALAGIAFADILMFMQMGFKDSLYEAAVRPHYALDADLVLVNSQFETFFSVKSFSRERLYQAQGFPGVESVNSLYFGTAEWRNTETRMSRPILIFGTDPANPAFNIPEVTQNADRLKMFHRVLFDRASRPEYGVVPIFEEKGFLETEVNDNLVRVDGLFSLGASFTADGNAIASDSTFLHLFSERKAEEIEIGLLKLEPSANLQQVQSSLKAELPKDVSVLTIEEFAKIEKQYWANSTAIGFIFSLGTAMGFIVGVVIVYQILYSDVSDHLPEYATLKAMGYTDQYLVNVLIQEALILAVLGFIPSFFLGVGLYHLTQAATLLPIGMTTSRAISVFILTVIMCTASGAIAMRKLQTADPADVFA